MLPNRALANNLSTPMRSSAGCGDLLDDKTKPNVVQIKGRFSVTSENVDLVKPPGQQPKEVGNNNSKEVGNSSPKEGGNSTIPASILMPHLQNLFQQTSFQQLREKKGKNLESDAGLPSPDLDPLPRLCEISLLEGKETSPCVGRRNKVTRSVSPREEKESPAGDSSPASDGRRGELHVKVCNFDLYRRYRRYIIPVRQVTDMRTARYRAVP
ncbi:hypothetical protein BHE74_00030570 [Ensete ventricosum]|nr:hypothetical protein BHE74_00030570 [Ensete ventricosum]